MSDSKDYACSIFICFPPLQDLLLSSDAKPWPMLFVIHCPVVFDSLRPRGLQHTRLPCPSHLPELAQTHVHWVSDAIQPSHPLSPPSPPALNLSQHQGLFQWVGFLQQVAKVLEFQLQHRSFQWLFRIDFLGEWLVWSQCCYISKTSVIIWSPPRPVCLWQTFSSFCHWLQRSQRLQTTTGLSWMMAQNYKLEIK